MSAASIIMTGTMAGDGSQQTATGSLPPRERIEAAIEALVDLLDAMEAPGEDLEAETDMDVEEVNTHYTQDPLGGAGDKDDAEPDEDGSDYSVPEWRPTVRACVR
jgi:hypothetical protein